MQNSAIKLGIYPSHLGCKAYFDLKALASRASAARGANIACAVRTPRVDNDSLSSIMGNVNYHVELRFDNGVCWISPIKRQNSSTPPPVVRDYMIRSEAATYSFLARTKIPAPRIFEVVLGTENPVGAGCILMEKVAGKPLSSTTPTPEQWRKVLEQLAGVYAELEKYPSSTSGSRSICYRPCPFHTTVAYYEAVITRIFNLISAGELYPLWGTDPFLIHRCLLDLNPRLIPPVSGTVEVDGSGEEFFLHHADDKGDHILVDHDYHYGHHRLEMGIYGT